jgi:hypothetical protein
LHGEIWGELGTNQGQGKASEWAIVLQVQDVWLTVGPAWVEHPLLLSVSWVPASRKACPGEKVSGGGKDLRNKWMSLVPVASKILLLLAPNKYSLPPTIDLFAGLNFSEQPAGSPLILLFIQLVKQYFFSQNQPISAEILPAERLR